jgi:hypothetical protein
MQPQFLMPFPYSAPSPFDTKRVCVPQNSVQPERYFPLTPGHKSDLLLELCLLCVISGVLQSASNDLATWRHAIDWLFVITLLYMTPLPRANKHARRSLQSKSCTRVR